MSQPVISVENLSKQYRLGQIGGRTLTEDLNRWWARARRRPNPYLKIGQEDASGRDGEYIWALRDVSFSVEQGEVLGIIGRNGAGKSTLLKILSRVTAPTSGQVKVKGRIASLLEVGTGFHPELTGRENIYLNGAILGMKTPEIDRKFNEIVDFSEIEKFIDTPVKRYSSGMYVRLAFAVAAHLDPEILIVDEVLAVGDIAFQKKCLGKMNYVAKEGRTVIFVSHNMSSISNLCGKAIWLDVGEIRDQGSTEKIITAYEESLSIKVHSISGKILRSSTNTKTPCIKWLEVRGTNNLPRTAFSFGEHLDLIVQIEGEIPLSPYLEWEIYSIKGHRVSSGGTFMVNDFRIVDDANPILCRIGPLSLAQGEYQLSLKLGALPGQVIDAWENAFRLRISSCDPDGVGIQFDSRRGDVYIPASYHTL